MDHQHHPLLNPLIVEQLLSYSNITDLLNHRNVCTTWYSVSLKRYKKPLIIIPSTSAASSATTIKKLGENSSTVTLTELEKILVANSGQGPLLFSPQRKELFRNVVLKDWELDETYFGAEEFPQFWDHIGVSLESLTLENCKFACPTAFLKFLNLENINMSSLKFMYVSPSLKNVGRSQARFENMMIYPFNRKFQESDRQTLPRANVRKLVCAGKILLGWPFFLAHFPNLEHLSIEDLSDISFRCSRNKLTYDFIYMVENLDFKLNLKALDMMHTYGLDMKQFIESDNENDVLHFPSLHKFCIRIDTNQNPEEEFGLFLDTPNLRNLNTLHLYGTPIQALYQSIPFTFYHENLTELCIWGSICKTLAFLKFIPRLTKLWIVTRPFDQFRYWEYHLSLEGSNNLSLTDVDMVALTESQNGELLDSGINLPDLKDLYLDCTLSSLSMKTLGKWMPNLEILQIIATNRTLPIICANWTNEEILNLVFLDCPSHFLC